MATFQSLQNKVLNHFGAADTEFRTEVKEAINDIIADINDRIPQAPHLEAEATFTCTVDTSTVTSGVPSDLNYVRNIYLTRSSKKDRPLTFLSRNEWNEQRLFDLGSGVPTHYTIWDNTLYVGPPPDTAYAGSMDYYKIDSALSADASTGLITSHYARWERLIIMGAKSRMHDYLQSDGQLIQKSAIDYERGLKQFSTWVRRNFNASPDASRIRGWKEVFDRNPLIPVELRRS